MLRQDPVHFFAPRPAKPEFDECKSGVGQLAINCDASRGTDIYS